MNIVKWAALLIAPLTVLATVLAAFLIPGTANASVTSQAKVCAAFAAWEKHRTTANINAVVADTLAMAWSGSARYVGEDAAGLYGDVRGGAAAKYVTSDVKYMTEDCAS
jgi:hypothetical protein